MNDFLSAPETPKMINVPPEEILGYSFNDDDYSIYINKSDYKLSLFKGHELIKTYPIAVGKNPGDKKRVGDNRTPVGDFHVVSIENASSWSHDFRDGKGKIKGAYGPWFIRLDAKGWKGIGIHGYTAVPAGPADRRASFKRLFGEIIHAVQRFGLDCVFRCGNADDSVHQARDRDRQERRQFLML